MKFPVIMGYCCNNNSSNQEGMLIVNKAREAAACAQANCASSFTNATNAATSETNVENLWEDFQERYMGPYATPPVAISEGSLYYNTTSNVLFVWNGSAWVSTDFNEFTNFTATGTTTARNLVTRMADVVNVKDFGAVGDGNSHPLSSVYTTLAAAQAVYPFVTSLSQELDWAAIQAALNYSVLNPLAIKPVFVPSGEYRVERIILPYGSILHGAGGMVHSLTFAGTRLIQNSNNDIFIFGSQSFGGSIEYWSGRISDISIIGNNTYTNGYAFNSINSSSTSVTFIDTTIFENISIRNMPQGGFLIRSAYPLTIKNVEFLWNGGPGITCTRVGGLGLYQGVHFSDVSGDGNINGLLNFSNMSRNDGFLISNLKSEARVNNVYGGGIGQQENAIVITSSTDSVIAINGANHISSIPDGLGNTKKPGDFIKITDGNLPKITWNGVIVGFPVSSTGTDPLIVKSTISYVYQPDYSVSSGTFNVQFPFHASKLLFHRNAVTGATPSVEKCNALSINNSSATTITNITDGIDGQFVILSFLNSNTTVQNNANIALNDGSDWTPDGNSSLSLIYIAGKWREVARSYGASTGTYTVTNLTTDRTYDANATTVDELADVLGTLIQDLNTRGVI